MLAELRPSLREKRSPEVRKSGSKTSLEAIRKAYSGPVYGPPMVRSGSAWRWAERRRVGFSAEFFPLEVSMVAAYDIFRKTNDSVAWVEAVEDIVTAKRRLISLASDGTDGYRIWDSTKQRFIDLKEDCA